MIIIKKNREYYIPEVILLMEPSHDRSSFFRRISFEILHVSDYFFSKVSTRFPHKDFWLEILNFEFSTVSRPQSSKFRVSTPCNKINAFKYKPGVFI